MKTTKTFLLAPAFIILAATAFGIFAYRPAEGAAEVVNFSASASSLSPSEIVLPVTPSPEQGVEAELITIRPTGFEPAEITRPQGEFLFAIHNRSGLDDVTLRLDYERGGRLHEARVNLGRQNWRRRIDPPPGRYVLTEANHPEWQCRIRITPR